jgi:hypothetical protein
MDKDQHAVRCATISLWLQDILNKAIGQLTPLARERWEAVKLQWRTDKVTSKALAEKQTDYLAQHCEDFSFESSYTLKYNNGKGEYSVGQPWRIPLYMYEFGSTCHIRGDGTDRPKAPTKNLDHRASMYQVEISLMIDKYKGNERLYNKEVAELNKKIATLSEKGPGTHGDDYQLIDARNSLYLLETYANMFHIKSKDAPKPKETLTPEPNNVPVPDYKPQNSHTMTKEECLRLCTVHGTTVKLPDERLDRNVYLEVAKTLELIGGKWKGGKVSGFIFAEDPTDLLAQVANGEKRNLKKEYQFFPTPDTLADRLVQLANIDPLARTIEPSAGQGAIVKAIQRAIPGKIVGCFELMKLNQTVLNNMDCATLLGEDFLRANYENYADRIVANPPFANNQDIDHIYKMYDVLKPGGRMVTVASTHWVGSKYMKEVAFACWLQDHHADVHDIPAGTFKESGTMYVPVIIVIDKPAVPEPVPTPEHAPAPESKNVPEPDNNKPKTEKAMSIEIVDYSEKAIAVFGDTKPLRKAFAEHGGRFNRFLKLNGEPTPGWVFSRRRIDEIRKVIA